MEFNYNPKIAYTAFLLSFILVFVLHFFINPSVRIEKSKSEIVIRYLDNISESQKELVKKFNSEYKGKYRVEVINFPLEKFSSNERKQLLIKYLRNRSDKIDVFSVDQVWVPRFSNWSQPLDEYFSKSEKEEIDSLSLHSCNYNGSLIAMPLFTDVGLMYARTEALKNHPNYESLVEKLQRSITWEEFIKLGQSEYFNDKPFYVFPADNYEGLMCSFIEVFSSENKLFNEENSLLKPEVIEAVQFIVDLVKKYKISPSDVINLQENNFGFYFFENESAFLRGWPNSFSSFFYINKNERAKNGMISIPLPHFEGKEKRFVRGGWNFMISKYSKKKEAAAIFLKFWLREEVQAYMYENNGFLPILKRFYYDENFVNKYDMINYYKELLNDSVFRPQNKNYTLLSDILTKYIRLSISKNISVPKALQKAQDEINSLQLEMSN